MTAFSETLMDHFQSPRIQGRIESPDAEGGAGVPGRGRYIVLYLRMADEKIGEAKFECFGCGVTVAVCSVLTEMIRGLSLEQCSELRPETIAEALDGIPPHKMDCAHFGIAALRDAIKQCSDVAKDRGMHQK